jgi:hypothetical protein
MHEPHRVRKGRLDVHFPILHPTSPTPRPSDQRRLSQQISLRPQRRRHFRRVLSVRVSVQSPAHREDGVGLPARMSHLVNPSPPSLSLLSHDLDELGLRNLRFQRPGRRAEKRNADLANRVPVQQPILPGGFRVKRFARADESRCCPPPS